MGIGGRDGMGARRKVVGLFGKSDHVETQLILREMYQEALYHYQNDNQDPIFSPKSSATLLIAPSFPLSCLLLLYLFPRTPPTPISHIIVVVLVIFTSITVTSVAAMNANLLPFEKAKRKIKGFS